MSKHERRMTNPVVLKAMAALGMTLMALGALPAAQTQNDISDGQVSVQSPDGTIQMTIRGNGPLTYSVSVDGKAVLAASRLGLKFKDGVTSGSRCPARQSGAKPCRHELGKPAREAPDRARLS